MVLDKIKCKVLSILIKDKGEAGELIPQPTFWIRLGRDLISFSSLRSSLLLFSLLLFS